MEERRQIGTTDLHVAPLCLGGNVFGWTADEAASFAVLDAYVAAGGNFIDTANTYSAWVPGHRGGESETIVGRWMARRGNRADMVIATKLGMSGGPDQPRGLSRASIRTNVEASLARLRCDHIDLYYAHQDDADTALAETMAAFDEIVLEGKVRAVAASNYTAARLREALDASAADGLARFAALQPHYNLLDRAEYEGGIADLCVAESIGVMPYYAVARGFLTGKYRPGGEVPQTPRAVGIRRAYMNDRGWSVLAVVDEVAAAHGATPAQVAIAWLMTRPAVVAPIASATSADQVADLAGAADLRLGEDELAALSAATA